MAEQSDIEWTDSSWNFIGGCFPKSTGCLNCYAMHMAHRLGARGIDLYRDVTKKTADGVKWTGGIRIDEKLIDQPLKWRKPRRVFVCSMSDLFYEVVPDRVILDVLRVMNKCPQHQFQILTKRIDRARELLKFKGKAAGFWPLENAMIGASAENQDEFDRRIEDLAHTRSYTRFLSLEPLLGPIQLRPRDFMANVNWVIVGGESGRRARECQVEWVQSIVDQCKRLRVPVFVKQYGSMPTMQGLPVKMSGKGGHQDEWPTAVAHEREQPVPWSERVSKTP